MSLFYFGKVTPESKDLLIFIAILYSTLKLCILAHLHSVKVAWKQHNIGVFLLSCMGNKIWSGLDLHDKHLLMLGSRG